MALIVSMLILASLILSGCRTGCRSDSVRYRHLSESRWPPPRDELPTVFKSLDRAHKQGYLRYGEVEVIGPKETALREAAKLGAEVVLLKAKAFRVGAGEEYYEWKEYRFQTEDGRWVTVREPALDSKGPRYEKLDGYSVQLFVHKSSRIWE
jgi:hypothetical protein